MKGEKGPQHLIEALSVPQLSVFSLITLPKPSPPKPSGLGTHKWEVSYSLPGALSRLPRLMGAEVGLGCKYLQLINRLPHALK